MVANRVAWAKTYLKKVGLLPNLTKVTVRITKKGIGVLAKKPATIDDKFLKQFLTFLEFVGRSQPEDTSSQAAGKD